MKKVVALSETFAPTFKDGIEVRIAPKTAVELITTFVIEFPTEITLLKYPRFAETEIELRIVAPPVRVMKVAEFWRVTFPVTRRVFERTTFPVTAKVFERTTFPVWIAELLKVADPLTVRLAPIK